MTPNAHMAAPETPMPSNGDMARAAIAREVLTQLVNEFTDGTIGETFRLTPAQRARMLGYIDSEYAAPSPTPPPIPLGAGVEVEGDPLAPYTRVAHGWRKRRDEATQRALDLSVALQVAECERDEARRALAEANEWRDKAVASCNAKNCAGRERSLYDALELIRELEAAAKDQGLGAATSERAKSRDDGDGSAGLDTPQPDASPAPASASRRWWMVVDRDEFVTVWKYQQDAEEHLAFCANHDTSGGHTVVPVIEARVTREMVERVAMTLASDWRRRFPVSSWEQSDDGLKNAYRSNARAALSAFGLTVEGNGNG